MASAGLGVTVAALFWFVDPAGAIPLESWDDKIPIATNRFRVLPEFSGQAVLDRETQLVWEQSPLTTLHVWVMSGGLSASARYQCMSRTTGGRKGWRLPSVFELASLVDPSVPFPGPTLPPGHPFLNVQAKYLSATTNASDPSEAWFVFFNFGEVSAGSKTTTSLGYVWCVRGAMNADAY
jgi:hypothetical protein